LREISHFLVGTGIGEIAFGIPIGPDLERIAYGIAVIGNRPVMQTLISLKISADHNLLEPDKAAPAVLNGCVERRETSGFQRLGGPDEIFPGLGLGNASLFKLLLVVHRDPARQMKRHAICLSIHSVEIAQGCRVVPARDDLVPDIVQGRDLTAFDQFFKDATCPPGEHIRHIAAGGRGLDKGLVLLRIGIRRLDDPVSSHLTGLISELLQGIGPEAFVMQQLDIGCRRYGPQYERPGSGQSSERSI